MNYYYLEHGILPAKYNFRDDANGALPSGWIQTTATGVIAASWQDHKKILKCTSAGGGSVYRLYQQFTAQADGDIEFWIGSTDCTNAHNFYFTKTTSIAAANIATVVFMLNDILYAYHGNGAGGVTGVNMGAITDNTIVHIRVHFDTATDKLSVWRDGVNYIDTENFYNDNVFAADELNTITLYGPDVAGAIGYYDAFGYSWDANYEIGDNREVDWHTYNKERITGIIQEPTIAPSLDAYWIGNFTVRDFEGSLFASWHDRDFNKILIEDDSANVLFRGFLIKKTFTKNSLALTVAGIGILLDWQPFGSDGYVNYVLAEGLVKAPISNDSILQVKTGAGADFTWVVDEWHGGGKDLGLLIVDKTDMNTRTWQSSAVSQSGGAIIAGNNASTLTFDDSDSYNVRDISSPNFDLKITPVIDAGVAVDDTEYLKSIEIQYNFRLKIIAGAAWINATIRIQILKDTTWYTFASINAKKYNETYTSEWQTGVPTDVAGGNGNQRLIEGADSTLQKYFNKTGATYTSLKGLRFILTGQGDVSGSAEIHVDFIKVVVGYMTDDISPIMEQITDSAATSLTCSSVSAWDETGVSEDDGFQIGQNTRVILQDISSQSGLNIFFGTPIRTHTLIPDQNGANNDWTLSGYARVITIDASAIAANLGDQGEYEEFGFPNSIDFPSNDVVTEIKVYTYGKKSGVDSNFRVRVYYNGSWEAEQASTCGAAYAWESHTFPITGGTVVPDDLKVSYRAFTVSDPSNVWIDACYVVVKVEYANAFERYTARKYIGATCMEPLRAICKLEGAYWYEDYINDRIVVLKEAAFIDSGVDLTQAGHEWEWVYEDECNQVRSFYVFGNAENEIFAKAIDETVNGYISKQIVDETISTTADAQEIADAQLALLNSKRPSFKIPLAADNVNLQLGKTVDITFVRPTIAKTNYIIRKIERSKKGISGIQTVIYCGLGESPIDEKIGKIIRDNAFRSHKALRDRLVSP